MNYKRILFLFILLLSMITTVSAQVSTVRGTVTSSADGLPVIGATVMVEGTKFAAATDIDGNFEINGITGNHKTLVVSYVGMKTKKVALKSQVTVELDANENDLEEVMVVAFGKQKRESFTGSAGVVKADKIVERQVSNPVLALNGKVSGVQMFEGATPQDDPTIRIRGVGSINAGNSPLIIVDGMPYNGYYSDLNPQDIENISVLKDAASNALYGARGANGVILITTKTAKRGQAVISFDARWGANMDGKQQYDIVKSPAQYYEMYYKALYDYNRSNGLDHYAAHQKANNTLGGAAADGGLEYMVYSVPENEFLIGENGKINPHATLGNVISYNGQEFTLYPDDWKDKSLRTGVRQEYTASVNGGTDQFQIYGSLGYLNNQGITHGAEYERYTGRLKADYQARKWLKLGGNVTYTHNENDYHTAALSYAYTMPPIYPLYLRDGNGNIMTDQNGKMYDWGDGLVNGIVRPVSKQSNGIQADKINLSNSNSNAFGAAAYADITFLNDFKLTTNVNIYDTENRDRAASNPYYGYLANSSNGWLDVYHYRTYSFNTQQLLNYNKQIDKHNISALIGHEYSRQSSTKLSGTATNLLVYQKNMELPLALEKSTTDSYYREYMVEGYMFRANYDYDSRYYGSFSFRRDASSRFHPKHRWGNFWSAGGAWIVSKENWFPKESFVNMLKYKISIGQQGNDNIGRYRYTDLYTIDVVNGAASLSFYQKGKEDITWETNTNFNTGLEFELFNRRLTGGIEYYIRKTTDMLLWFTTPISIGYSGYYTNVGDMKNQGVEFELNGEIIRSKNVSWSLNMNITHNKNEVYYLPDANKTMTIDGHSGYSNITYYRYVGEGLPIYTWYMPKYAGVNEEGQSLWYRDRTVTTTDANGNSVTETRRETTTVYSNASYYLCGDPHPKVYGGFGTNLKVYGFDLSANFMYSIGGKAYDYGYAATMGVPVAGVEPKNFHKDLLNAWTTENTTSNIPRLRFGDQGTTGFSDRFLTNSSTLTLKNIAFGYTFPKELVKKLYLTSLRVYVSADNVYYWSKRKGFDPRNSYNGEPSATAYPTTRTISGGISVKF